MIKLQVLFDNIVNCPKIIPNTLVSPMFCQGDTHFGFPRCPYFDSFSFEETGFCVICNYEKKTLKDRLKDFVNSNEIGKEFSDYGLDMFVRQIIDIMKKDKE